ncbi:hypothetical protein HYPSUDRAFT_205771 [Hypholoma sublateritium FD-334 SS-4]|uniref:F-box domain-containing protein n=1 Tax=Hypholoma sublateritium (strain FD-334 SS-4) TaxID=945553 RepID=A0A0D2NG06_HYPSF|nr:hypothetical protein HYPSUDRAFT_205771 [Hypholoma sublateritium FD-334 SS-4]
MHASLPLPVEILGNILRRIDDYQTLYLVALVCRRFYPEASMILYRSPKNLSPYRHITFLSSLASDPRLACLVRSYKLPPIAGKQRITCLELLRITLPMMINLKELSIMATANEMQILPMPRLTFQVENLSWIQIDSTKNDQFMRWAQSQKSMKHLRWIHREAVEISRSAFPDLVSLEGNLHVVEALMPGRSIRRLHWIADAFYDGEFNVRNKLAVEMGNLQSLTFEDGFNTIKYSMIACHLHSLTFLELVGDFHKSVRFLSTSIFMPNAVLIYVKGHGDDSITTHLEDLGILSGPNDR